MIYLRCPPWLPFPATSHFRPADARVTGTLASGVAIWATIAIWAIGSLLSLTASFAQADEDAFLRWDAQLNLEVDYNVGKAHRSRDKVTDHHGSLVLATAHDFFINDYHAIQLQLIAQHHSYKDVDQLSHWRAGGKAAYLWQPGTGFFSPLLQANTRLEVWEFDQAQRSSTVSTSQLLALQRLTDSLSGHLGAEYQHRDSDGTAFDLAQNRLFLGLDFQWSPALVFYGSYSYVRGDISSTAQVRFCNGNLAPDIFYLVQAADALEPDHAFNDAFCGEWVAYKLDADTHVGLLGGNFAFGEGWAVDAAATYALSEVNAQIDYKRPLLTLSLFKSF